MSKDNEEAKEGKLGKQLKETEAKWQEIDKHHTVKEIEENAKQNNSPKENGQVNGKELDQKSQTAPDSLTELSKRNEEVAAGVEKAEQNYSYEYGPLNKSEETKEETKKYEQIIHELIEDISSRQNKAEVYLDKGELYYKNESSEQFTEPTNLTQLKKDANAGHVAISNEDLETYANNKRLHIHKAIKSSNSKGKTENKLSEVRTKRVHNFDNDYFNNKIDEAAAKQAEDVYRIAELVKEDITDEKLQKRLDRVVKREVKSLNKGKGIKIKDRNKQESLIGDQDANKAALESAINELEGINALKNLSHAEKIAINKYTSHNYTYDNYLNWGLYDKFQDKKGELNQGAVKQFLVDNAVAAHALNNVPTVNTPTVTRYKNDYGRDQMIEDAKENNVYKESSYLSTGYAPEKSFEKQADGTLSDRVIIKNVPGVNVAPLSDSPGEKEYLIAESTQIRVTGHSVDKDGRHIFTAEGANVLMDTKKHRRELSEKDQFISRARQPKPEPIKKMDASIPGEATKKKSSVSKLAVKRASSARKHVVHAGADVKSEVKDTAPVKRASSARKHVVHAGAGVKSEVKNTAPVKRASSARKHVVHAGTDVKSEVKNTAPVKRASSARKHVVHAGADVKSEMKNTAPVKRASSARKRVVHAGADVKSEVKNSIPRSLSAPNLSSVPKSSSMPSLPVEKGVSATKLARKSSANLKKHVVKTEKLTVEKGNSPKKSMSATKLAKKYSIKTKQHVADTNLSKSKSHIGLAKSKSKTSSKGIS